MHLLKSFLVFLRSVEDSQYQAAVSSESAEGEKMLQSRKVGKHCWRDLFTFFTVFKDMPSLKALHEDEFSELNLNTTLDAFHVYCLSAQVGITLSSSNADVRLNDPSRSRAAKRQRSL